MLSDVNLQYQYQYMKQMVIDKAHNVYKSHTICSLQLGILH